MKRKRKKTDVEQYGSDSLIIFLVVMGIGYISIFIWNHFGA